MSLGPGGSVLTVGTFDGIHRGHRALLDAVGRRAEALGERSALVTFDPHPLRVVRPESEPRLLTPPAEKKELLAATGLDATVVLAFTPALSEYPPRRFVEEILIARLGLRELIIGYDHALGSDRSGDEETLRRLGREHGFGVRVVPAVERNGAPVSSSRIREALAAGRVDAAAEALGRPYTLDGTVVRGEGRGRALGVPTANLRVCGTRKLLPQEGIYAVRAAIRGRVGADADRAGVLHLGPRPTFEDTPPSVELHLLDFEGELYGERVRVEFHARLRGVERFESTDALVEAMWADIAAAREVFTGGGALP